MHFLNHLDSFIGVKYDGGGRGKIDQGDYVYALKNTASFSPRLI